MTNSIQSLERLLLKAWSAVFTERTLGVDDDFFSLAGEGSAGILGIRLRSAMEKCLQREIPLSLLIQAPTIRGLARLLTEKQTLEWPLIVKLSREEEGRGHPFFFFPPLDGNSIWYAPLAFGLGPVCTAWGLEIPGMDKRHRPLFSIRELVARFVTQIRSIQPAGPYFLGGYSFGGLLAFEAAVQLEEAGEEVGLLAMIDRSCPLKGKTVLGGMICPPELIPGRVSLRRKIDLHWNWSTRWIKTKFRLAIAAPFWNRGERVSNTRVIMKAAALQMMAFYNPGSTLKGRMALLRQEGYGPLGRRLDETYGWSGYAVSRIEKRFIPGPHESVLDGKNIPSLVSTLAPFLRREEGAQ